MSKKSTMYNQNVTAPETLARHQFFGLDLDEEQIKFRDSIWDKDKLIVFCNSVSGTGKTTIAAGTAELLVRYGRYKNVVYVASPNQESKQGFLPGSLEEKSDPYFAPFYQALIKIGVNINTSLTSDIMNMKYDTGYISCITHTFLRGSTFEDSVVILDEAQNYEFDNLKKTLTRISDSCKTIVIGHALQADISDNKNGFEKYIEHYSRDERTAICKLTTNYRGWVSSHADKLHL